MLRQFIEQLKDIIDRGLPGLEAHQKMAPSNRPLQLFNEQDYPNAKKGSVLLLFYPYENEIQIVFIKRKDYEGVHSGQVSFPGGKIEADDIDSSFTALRETEEEIGVQKKLITLFGKLSDVYIPPSNFFVYPYLGFCETHPQFIPDNNEVEYIIESPLRNIFDKTNKGITEIKRGELIMQAPYYNIKNHKVWGATAMILSELEMLMEKIQLK